MSRRKKTDRQITSVNLSNYGSYDKNETICQILIQRIRNTGSYATGDQVAPCVILWTDPDRLWECIIDDMKKQIPELYSLGPYSPNHRTGPSIWLKCIESRSIEAPHPLRNIPIFYLPGVSKQQLDDAENCPPEIQPLVEYQYRGALWHHPNGKDWTPFAFLSSEQMGLELDISKDAATRNALQRALPILLIKSVGYFGKDHIDADYINHLLAPDLIQAILLWMNDPEVIKKNTREELEAFEEQTENEFGFHPGKDGELTAARLLAQRSDPWDRVWKRFKEAPQNYPDVIKLLLRLDPPSSYSDNDMLEPYAQFNDAQEKELSRSFIELRNKRCDEVASQIIELEKIHGHRREWVWAKMGRSQLALALGHLFKLARSTDKPLNSSSMNDLAQLYYEKGWEIDSELLETLACSTTRDQEEPIRDVARAIYIDWLDNSSLNLQALIKREGDRVQPRLERIQASAGRMILFVDGLRLDLAHKLVHKLVFQGLQIKMDWDWSPFPSITQTAKYYVSPISHLLKGRVDSSSMDLTPSIAESGQQLNQIRFEDLLKKNDIQVIDDRSTGNIKGQGWTESGTIDQSGHSDQWLLSKKIEQELNDLSLRIEALIKNGWEEVLIVTDHGWLLAPNGLNKLDLPKNLTDMKWGRCAIMKELTTTDLQLIPWYWDDAVAVASPRSACCFRSGVEYTHGGVSLQELVVPRISVKRDGSSSDSRIVDHKWIGLRCHIIIINPTNDETVDIRLQAANPDSSMIDGKKPKRLSSDGSISLPVENPDDEGKECSVVLLNKNGEVLHSVITLIGGRA